jgi:hypothetical protein
MAKNRNQNRAASERSTRPSADRGGKAAGEERMRPAERAVAEAIPVGGEERLTGGKRRGRKFGHN